MVITIHQFYKYLCSISLHRLDYKLPVGKDPADLFTKVSSLNIYWTTLNDKSILLSLIVLKSWE